MKVSHYDCISCAVHLPGIFSEDATTLCEPIPEEGNGQGTLRHSIIIYVYYMYCVIIMHCIHVLYIGTNICMLVQPYPLSLSKQHAESHLIQSGLYYPARMRKG